jgi:hypothetical protein
MHPTMLSVQPESLPPVIGKFCAHHRRMLFSWILAVCFLIFHGCATFKPGAIDESVFRNRGQTKSDGLVQATVTVLSRDETRKVFGLDLYKKGIQPIWIEIENNDDVRVWFPPFGVDPDYFAPFEVAYTHHFFFSKRTNAQMDLYFYEKAMTTYVPPGNVRSGFVFTNMDLGTKGLNVDLVARDQEIRTFTFFIPVPGSKVSHRDVDWDSLYSKGEIVSYDDVESFRTALEALPCCSTDQKANKEGDPLNLIFIGSEKALHQALIRSGWDETEQLNADSALMMKTIDIVTKQDRYAPLIPFYLYGRPQDAAFSKTRKAVDERNHLRLWLSPMRFAGKPVWVGQISRDIKVRFLPNTYQIEPLVDEARTYMLQDIWYAQGLIKFGYVKGVGAASMSEPRQTFSNDPYFTDGYRAVLWVSSRPVSFSDVENLNWEQPYKPTEGN